MSENANATTEAVGTPEAPAAEAQTQAQDTEAQTTDARSLDNLPAGFEWVRDEISKLRNEAAKYRTRAREFADDATYHAAKTAIERLPEVEDAKSAAESRVGELERELARARAAVRHGLTSEALDFLTGDTEEEIEDRAKRLAEMMSRPERRPDPSQGSTAGSGKPASTAESFAAALQQWLN